MSDNTTRFSAQEYGTLLQLMMTADPWPLAASERDRMVGMLNDEAEARGYDGWVEAYHELHMGGDE